MKIKARKQAIITIIMISALVLIMGLGIFLGAKPARAPQINIAQGNYVFDVENPREVTGHADFVVLGRVEQVGKVEYEDVFLRETEEGPKLTGDPYTNYMITVLENLKGSLELNATISAMKRGGISMDGSYLFLFEGDFLPEEGDICVFFMNVQQDGSLLIAGKNSNIKIVESTLTEKTAKVMEPAQARKATQDELKAIADSSAYQEMAAACENEIPFERERYTAPLELLAEPIGQLD